MRGRKIYLSLAIPLLLLLLNLSSLQGYWMIEDFPLPYLKSDAEKVESPLPNSKEIWIEIHDVSPSYGVEPLLAITDILEKHPGAYSKVVLFVIPNHGKSAPLREFPEFVKVLKKLEARGYVIGMHGYAHPDPMLGIEFATNMETSRSLLEAGRTEFDASDLESTYFAPPGWGASAEARELLKEEFDYVYYYRFIDTTSNTLAYPAHEYMWYRINLGLAKAESDYQKNKGIFRLSVHLQAANTKKNLKFLDDFLSYVEASN
ncbi:MAG: DUF2334 domain-containing protein [Candidatus Hydrothermarchaeales archaeon]